MAFEDQRLYRSGRRITLIAEITDRIGLAGVGVGLFLARDGRRDGGIDQDDRLRDSASGK